MQLGLTPVPRRVDPTSLSLSIYEISIRMPNSTLQALSHTSLWREVAAATRDQNWWRRRTEYLVHQSLVPRIGDWARVYASLSEHGLEFNGEQDYGSTLLIEVLLEIGADPSLHLRDVLQQAIRTATAGSFTLLLRDPRVVLSPSSHYLIWAIGESKVEIVRLLLEDRRIDPGLLEDEAIISAVEEGNTEIIRLLLADERVNASTENNRPIHEAVKYNFIDIFELLLNNKRVMKYASSVPDGYGLMDAILGNRTQMVRLIVDKYGRYAFAGAELLAAVKVGNLEIVKMFLSLRGLPENDDVFRLARNRGHKEILEYLLAVEAKEDEEFRRDMEDERRGN